MASVFHAWEETQAWMPIFSASCITLWKSWVWNGLPQRNLPVASWINGSCRGAVRPLDNELRHSSQRFMMSPSLGVLQTHPAYLPRLDESVAAHLCPPTAFGWKPLLCLLAPRSVPGADGRVLVKNTVVNIGSFHIAPTQAIAVIARKIKHKHIQKESTFPLPLIMSQRPPPSGLPLETIQPLATLAEACQAIPEVSDWVLGIIKQGYTLKFAQRPLAIWHRGRHIGSAQQRSHTSHRSDEFAGERT